MDLLPLVSHGDSRAIVAVRAGRTHTVADFIADVARVASQLPERRYLVNFCGDRYRFSVGLAAALVRDQVSLLPPSQTPEMLGQLEREYGPLYALTDVPRDDAPLEQVIYPGEDACGSEPSPIPAIPSARVAAIAFTSGSTGKPSAHSKSWGALVRGARAEARTFGLDGARGEVTIVATVPPQHMYGLESSVLMPLQNGLVLHAGRPFYAADVASALGEARGARVLVATPVHLRALLEDAVALPPLRLIVCATAPLSTEMAARAEARFATVLREVYGFTEAGMVATRRTVEGPRWQCLPGVRLELEGDTVHAAGGHVPARVPFSDIVELQGPDSFVLHGRSADMVNIAGKRTSLAYLNHQLNGIDGVRDGVFFMPDDAPDGVARPIAFAVAPGLSREDLMRALRSRVDAVFLPRPLLMVDSLPRNATGKLQREALAQLARTRVPIAPVSVSRRMAADHPAGPGHFPGNPILPGVVLLDEVIATAREQGRLPAGACTVRSAKFTRAVRPGEELVITLDSGADGSVRFDCRVGAEAAVTGTVRAGAGDA